VTVTERDHFDSDWIRFTEVNDLSKMLSSWKEIALFFGKGVRTVQRWEKTLDLPIHRPPGAPSNVVLARTSDLEEWMHRGSIPKDEPEESNATIASLPRLEQELVELAHKFGVSADLSHAGNAEERVRALADAVAKVNARVSSGGVARVA